MGFFITATNFLMLLLWLRLWRPDKEGFTFNPILSGAARLVDSIVDFLKPVLIGMPERAIALITILFVIVFRGILLASSGSDWYIVLGMTFGRVLPTNDLTGAIIFSATDFGVFLIRLWGLALLVRLMTPTPRQDRITDAFTQLTRPISTLPLFSMALTVALLNALLVVHLLYIEKAAAITMRNGLTTIPLAIDWSIMPQAALHFVWMIALSMSDIFFFAYSTMMGVVIVSLISSITRNQGLQQLMQEAVNFLLGGFGHRPVTIGMLDLTPLAYFFAMNIIYGFTTMFLRSLLTTVV